MNRVCREIILRTPCEYGDTCKFIHTLDQLAKFGGPEKCRRNQACKSWETCPYKHSEESTEKYYIRVGLKQGEKHHSRKSNNNVSDNWTVA